MALSNAERQARWREKRNKLAKEAERLRDRPATKPKIDSATLSMTAQQKLEAAIRQHKKKLDAEFERRVFDECRKRVEETILPSYTERHAEHLRVIEARKGIFDRATFNYIRSCLHPDRVQDPELRKRFEKAFRLFNEAERLALDEKQMPTPAYSWPTTYEEMMALKRKVAEGRKAKREASHSAVKSR
jgi:hypothetical protein